MNRICGISAAIIGLILLAWVIPLQTAPVSYGATTPALFPSLGAGVMVVAGLWQGIAPKGNIYVSPRNIVISGGLTLFAAAAFGLMHLIGYVVVAPAFAITLMLVKKERRPLWLISGGLVLPLFIWLVFVHVLERPLP